VDNTQDQIKRDLDDFFRHDALRTEALLRVIGAQSHINGKTNGTGFKRPTVQPSNGGRGRKPPLIGRPPKEGTKAAAVLAMLARPTTIHDIQSASQWTENTVRGFLSTAPDRFQVVITSTKNSHGKRVYFIP
jgi:hypothetical protein